MSKDQLSDIEQLENQFYMGFLNKAIDYSNNAKNVDGVQFRQMVAAAGVVAKQRQTRGAMKALEYQIKRDSLKFGNNSNLITNNS